MDVSYQLSPVNFTPESSPLPSPGIELTLFGYVYIFRIIVLIFVVMFITTFHGVARGVMVIVVGNGHGDRIQILDEADCISHITNTLGKGMNPIIIPPAMGK